MALADPIRLEIKVLAQGERCVCDLTADLDLAQSRLSFHLKVMKESGLLADRQEGRWVCHRPRREAIEELRGWLATLSQGSTVPAPPCP